jgi:hypothetical protein
MSRNKSLSDELSAATASSGVQTRNFQQRLSGTLEVRRNERRTGLQSALLYGERRVGPFR